MHPLLSRDRQVQCGIRFATCLLAIVLSACGGGDDAAPTWPEATTATASTLPPPGPQQATGRALDLAIDGAGAFVFEDAEGRIVHSRVARLSLDANGRLASPEGWHLLGDGVGRVSMSGPPVRASITVDEAMNRTLRLAPALPQNARTNEAPLRPDDLSSWAECESVAVTDADGHRVWLAFFWRKRSELRWDVHMVPFNVPFDAERASRPIAELDFGSNASGPLALPRVVVSVPASVDGQGQATVPIPGLVVDFEGTTLVRREEGMENVRSSGWGVGGLQEIDFLQLRARDAFGGIRISPSGEVSSWSRNLISGEETSRSLGRLLLAQEQTCAPACNGLRYGTPGSDGYSLLRPGWIETPNPSPPSASSPGTPPRGEGAAFRGRLREL